MEPVKQFFTQRFVEMAQHLTPILKESKFRETGVLTPEEFVAAGDHLVHLCPTWHWDKGDESKIREFLPSNKQFLVTKNVPCYKRVKEVDTHTDDLEKLIEIDETGSGWLDTHHFSKTNEVGFAVADLKMEDKASRDLEKKATLSAASHNNDDDEDDDEEAEDMEAFISSGKLEEDDECVAKATTSSTSEEQPDIVHTRTYDLHITYDKYYQTPRLWLLGYNEKRQPLTVTEMYEDISEDHAHKSVTMENHPNLSTNVPVASVHPCRHAEVMKKIIETVAEGGKELGVHLYLLIFLKFMQAVIPTIEYDFTQNFVLEHGS